MKNVFGENPIFTEYNLYLHMEVLFSNNVDDAGAASALKHICEV